MASMFNSLNIGYSGLNVSQAGISTVSHNIANAESDGYTRQRIVTSAAMPISQKPGQVGNGSEVTDIKRVFDNFVFDRYSDISSDKEASDYEKKTLEQLSTYFPEIDNVGIKADLAEFYNMWQTFADNPDSDAIKVALAKQTQTLSSHITKTQDQVLFLQSQINDELAVSIEEVNSIAKEVANLNKAIDTAESGDNYTANDLRDKRNVMERNLSKLIGADVAVDQMTSNTQIDSSSNMRTGSYSINVNGFNIVDGATFHPIHTEKEDNKYGFYSISYERQDAVLIPMEETIKSGKIGAILELRGRDVKTTSGMPVDGVVQKTVSELDAFANSLIESVNNIYASSATTQMNSNKIDLDKDSSLTSSSLNIKDGSFDVVVYDIDGNETARRNINIDVATSMTGAKGSNSIEGQINAQVDDNDDSNANNDIDDFVNFKWETYKDGTNGVEFKLDVVAESKGYTFAIEDKLSDSSFSSGSNFAGALGLSKFFDGTNARDIKLEGSLERNPTLISAGSNPASGDKTVALNIMQHQFEEFDFNVGSVEYKTTSYGMFDMLATGVGTATNSAILKNETVSTQFNAVELEYFATSKVSIDEEMTNLIKYQTAYGAAAKVISTIDQMMQTLLGIKN